jgi:hypothetical protein
MQMIDVLKKLQEISDKSPEAIKALDNVSRMNAPVAEGVEIKTSGEDAILAQILKLAGMVGGVNSPDMAATQGDMPVAGMGAPEGGIPGLPGLPAMAAQADQDMPGIGGMPSMGSAGPTAELPPVSISLPDQGPSDDMDHMDMGAISAAEGTDDRPYTNSPHEVTKDISAAVPSGNDLAKPKSTSPKVAGGDNPLQHVSVSFD